MKSAINRLFFNCYKLIFLCFFVTVFCGVSETAFSQGVTNITVNGIQPYIQEPYVDQFEENFQNGRYLVIFTYNNSSNPGKQVDFRFRFKLSKAGEEVVNVVSEPKSFYPGTYVFPAIFQDLPFPQTFKEVLNQVDNDIKRQILQEGTLPEGDYLLTIEAIPPSDDNGTIANPPSFTPFSVRFPQAPELIIPSNDSNLALETPVFSWLPVTGLQGFSVQYDFLLVEVLKGQTPLQAINGNRAHAQRSLIDQINLTYTPEFLPLEKGQKYAWQITASFPNETYPIKNDGESKIRTFTYKADATSDIASEDSEDVEEIPLQQDFAVLTDLEELQITEQPNSILINGPATLEVYFAGSSNPKEFGVDVQNLRLQKGSLGMPVIIGGSVVAQGQFFEDMLGEAGTAVDLNELRWDTGKGLTAKAELTTPDESTVTANGDVYISRSGLRGVVKAEGSPIASLGASPLQLELSQIRAAFPEGQITGSGNIKTIEEVQCSVPYMSLTGGFDIGIDCEIDEDVPLVQNSNQLMLGLEDVTGRVTGSWTTNEIEYNLELGTNLGIKLKDDRYCENTTTLSLSSEDGLTVDTIIPSCVDPEPTLDLGILQLTFSDLAVNKMGFDQQKDSWDFEMAFDAELFFPTAPNAKLPKIEDITLSRDGIHFPEIQFLEPDLQAMGEVAVDQVGFQIRKFALDQFTFPLFNWQENGTGPWDFTFEAAMELPDGPNYPPCLNDTNLLITGGHVEDRGDGNREVFADIEPQNMSSCAWPFGSGHSLNIDDLSGSLQMSVVNDRIEASSEVIVDGNLALGQPFNCGQGEAIDLTETQLKISGGVNGIIENVAPDCPVQVGPYTAEITSSQFEFTHSESRGQQAIMEAQAELEISPTKSATGGIKVDLITGRIDSAAFNIQGPFEWGIPKENPVLTFTVDEARVTEDGFYVDGRQELAIKNETIGATFDQLLFDWETFEVKEGSIILDQAFAFQAGIDSVSKQLDYQATVGDSTLVFSPGLLMQLAGTVRIDTLGLHTSGTAQTQLDFAGLALDSLDIDYSQDFAMGFKPFGIKRGRAELFWKNQRVAYADNSGFHPDIAFFGEQFLPERLPLPTEQIAYIQLKENDELVVNTTTLQNGVVKIETKPNVPLKLVLPALKGNKPQAPEVSVSLNNVRVNPSTGSYIGGRITANISQGGSQFDLDQLNIPLVLNQIEYGKRMVNGNQVERLFLDGNLKLFKEDLGPSGSISLFIESDGFVKGDIDLPNLNESIPLDPNSNRVIAKLDSLGGTVQGIPLLSSGNGQFAFNIKGGFQIHNQDNSEAARADMRMRFDDQGLSLTDFNASALQDTTSLDLGVFGFDISNINSLSLGYTEQNGFNYFAALDFTIRLNLPNQQSMAFPLKNVEIRNDLGFVIPQQDIHDGSNPSLNAPAIDMGIFRLKPLAFRMQGDTLNWHSWSPGDLVDIFPKVDMELSMPGYQNTAPKLSQLSITLQNIGFSDGVFTGTMIPLDRSNDPIFLPIGSGAGINIDGISGGLLDPGDGNQGFNIELEGYFDMPSYFMAGGQTCNQSRVNVSLSRFGGVSGAIEDFLPCGEVEVGPLALGFGQSTLDLSFSNDTQQATLTGGATADIERESGSPITATGNLTFDLLQGKVLSGDVGINQNFDWYFPAEDSLFSFGVQSAKIDTAGLVFTGSGDMKAGDGSVNVAFNDLAFSLSDGSLSYGSVDILSSFALDIGLNPTKWEINSTSDSMMVDPGMRLTMPSNLTLDKSGLQVDGSSGASLRYGNEEFSDINLDFVNMMIGFDPVGVTSGRADLILNPEGEDSTRLAWFDSQGFHPDNLAGGIPLPDTLGLPSKDVAYIVLKDQNGDNLVQSSAVNGGLSLSTNQPVSMVLASMEDPNGDHPTIDVSFSNIVINGAYEVTSGSITADLSQTPLNLGNYGDYPFGLMALHFMKEQGSPYKMYADAEIDLPESLTDVGLLLEKIALGPDGFENTTLSFGSYTTSHTEGNEPVIASHSFSNNALHMALRGAELEFGANNSYRLSGDISSNFLKNANGDSVVVHFAADYANSSWQFALDADHVTPQEFPVGQGKLILDDLQADVSQQVFAMVIDGRFALSDIAGDDLEIGIEGLRVGTDGISIDNVNSSAITPQSLSLFGETDNMTISSLNLQLTSQNHLMIEMDGSLSFLDKSFDFTDFRIGSDGTFAMGSGGVNLIDGQNPVELMEQYLVLTNLSIGIQNDKAALTATGDVTLPAPFSSSSTTSITVDHTGHVTSSGPQFQLNDASVDLGDIATLKLTGAGLEINDISTPDITLYGSAEVAIDGNMISLGSPGGPSNWGLRYRLAESVSQGLEWSSPSNHPSFTFNAGFFDLTIAQVKMIDGQSFGLDISADAGMSLQGIGGSLALEGFQITSSGINSMGTVTGGGLNLANVVDIELGSFDWQQNATIEIETQDGSKENPGSKIEQIQVEEYLSFSSSSGNGGNAVEITIPGGFSGSINEILYYKTSNSLYLNIDGVDIKLSDYAELYASFEYEKQPNGFRLKVAGGGNITAGGQSYGIGAMGRMSNLNNQFSFGIFVSVQAEIPIVPGVVSLSEAGGGFFYKASTQDFEDVVALTDYEFFNDEAPWVDKSTEYDFAIALHAGIGIVGMGNAYAVSGKTMILITDQWFALDVQGTILSQDGNLMGGMYLTTTWNPSFKMEGGVGLKVDYPGLITGEISVNLDVREIPSGDTVWAIIGNGELQIVEFISIDSQMIINSVGFYKELNVSINESVSIVSINSTLHGSMWWIYGEQFGAYVKFGFDASLFGGAASISGDLKGALIFDNGPLIYASASAHVKVVMVFEGRVSVWAAFDDGRLRGGKGSNGAYESMIEDARDQAEEMIDKVNDALDAAKELESKPDILKISENQLAAAGSSILRAGESYRTNIYNNLYSNEQDISSGSPPSIYNDIRSHITAVSAIPQKSAFNLSSSRGQMESAIDNLTQIAGDVQTRLQNTRTAAIEWEAQAEEMADNVINDPVSSVQSDWQGDEPPTFNVDENQSASNEGSLTQLKQDIDAIDQKYKAALDSIRTNIDRIDEALSMKLPSFNMQQNLDGTYNISSQGDFEPSANYVSESYINATKAIDKFYGDYISFFWSTHYWAKSNLAAFQNIRSSGSAVRNAVISASENQLQDVGVSVSFQDTNNVTVNGMSGSNTEMKGTVKNTAVDRYDIYLSANPNINTSEAASLRSGFAGKMDGYWNNSDYQSFYGNFIYKGVEVWYKMPKLGYETIRDTAQTRAVNLADSYNTNLDQMENAHETFTRLVDEIYEIRVSMSTTLHGLLETYIGWKSDTTATSDSVITVLEQEKQDLEQQLAAPQISNIYYTKTLADFSNKVELTWTANHPAGSIVENSYQLSPGSNASVFGRDMLSTGSKKEVTRYLFKEELSQRDRNFNVTIRARGPAGVAISKAATFRVAVDKELSGYGDQESGGVTAQISEDDTTPPTKPLVGLDLHTSTRLVTGSSGGLNSYPMFNQVESYWTQNNDKLVFEVLSVDNESDIAGFEYAIGTTEGGTDIRDWTTAQGKRITSQSGTFQNMSGTDNIAQEITARNLNMNSGEDYYLSVRSINGDSLVSTHKELNKSIRYDDADPSSPTAALQVFSMTAMNITGGYTTSSVTEAPDMLDIPSVSKQDPEINLDWNASSDEGSGVRKYEFVVTSESDPLTAFNEGDIQSSWDTEEMITGDPLSFSDSVYIHLRAVDYADRLSDPLTFEPIKPRDPTSPTTPVMRASVKNSEPGFYLVRPSVDLETDISDYELAIGGSEDSENLQGWSNQDMSSISLMLGFWRYYALNDLDWPSREANFIGTPMQNISDGQEVYLQLRTKNGQGMESYTTSSGPITYDSSPPKNPSISLSKSSYNAQLSISVSNIQDPHSGVTKVEYKVIDNSEYLPSRRIVKDWGDFMQISGTPTTSLSGSNSVDISGHSFMDLRILIRVTNGNDLQNTVTKTPALNNFSNSSSNINYNINF